MCLLALVLNAPSVSCAVLHLRDERLSRAAASPCHHQAVFAGIDLTGGGTWMGFCRRNGVACAITNVRCSLAAPTGAASRGSLVAALLRGTPAFEDVAAAAESGGQLTLAACYAPFNLILVRVGKGTRRAEAYSMTNVAAANVAATATSGGEAQWVRASSSAADNETGCVATVIRLCSGVHVISNAPLGGDGPPWPKVAWLSTQLLDAMTAGERGGAAPGAASILDVLARPLLHTEPVAAAAPSIGTAPTPLPPLSRIEALLRSHVIIPPHVTTDYGSRCITALVQEEGRVGGCCFSWHELVGAGAGMVPTCSQCVCGEPGDEGVTEHAFTAAGVTWRGLTITPTPAVA